MKTLDSIQAEIYSWSHRNFGFTATPHIPICLKNPVTGAWEQAKTTINLKFDGQDDIFLLAALDHIAPLLGLIEEVGELLTAEDDEDADEVLDALGDVMIYMLDFSGRCNIKIKVTRGKSAPKLYIKNPGIGIVSSLGKLVHSVLKRCQGIRGFEDDAYYQKEAETSANVVVAYVDKFIQQNLKGTDIIQITNDVWEKVKLRDWNKTRAAQQATPIVSSCEDDDTGEALREKRDNELYAEHERKAGRMIPKEVPIEEFEKTQQKKSKASDVLISRALKNGWKITNMGFMIAPKPVSIEFSKLQTVIYEGKEVRMPSNLRQILEETTEGEFDNWTPAQPAVGPSDAAE